jgi:glycosyltransferase involved in cell wall biosynthesis
VGGASGLTAWALQALRGSWKLSLATLESVDWDAMNRSFGTSLAAEDVEVLRPPPRYYKLLKVTPNPGGLLDVQLTTRWAQNLDQKDRFDLLLSAINEVDFGRPGIQYVNLPKAHMLRPGDPQRLSHRVPGLHQAFQLMCARVGRTRSRGIMENLFLANSQFIAQEIKYAYGAPSQVLYPPVPTDFPDVPWSERRVALIGVGRLVALKRWADAVEIVDRLRAAGQEIGLTIVGHRDDEAVARELEALAASRPWFRIASDLTRAELARLIASHRYGIHTMHGEHFGIGPAEILRAGCLPFVHKSGGPMEIVNHPELMFEDNADAATKIGRVLADSALETQLREHAVRQGEQFSTEAFCEGLRRIVEEFTKRPA